MLDFINNTVSFIANIVSSDGFIIYIDSNNDRISDHEFHLRKISNKSSTIINNFINNVVNRIQAIKLPLEQSSHFNEGRAGGQYLHNYIVFYPGFSFPIDIINFTFDGEITDKLISENDKVFSRNINNPYQRIY